MTHSLAEEFRDRVNAFLSRTGMSPTSFGKRVANDGSFVADLNSGTREVRLSTIEKVDKYIAGFEAGVAHAASDDGDDGASCLTHRF